MEMSFEERLRVVEKFMREGAIPLDRLPLRNIQESMMLNWQPAGSELLLPGSIVNSTLATNAVDARVIAPDAVGSSEIAADAVGASELANNAVDTAAVQANAISQVLVADATTSAPTTASAADPMTAVIPEMTITATFTGGPVIALFTGTFSHSVAGTNSAVELYQDAARTAFGGTNRTRRQFNQKATTGHQEVLSLTFGWTPAAGAHTIDMRWKTGAATLTAVLDQRQLVLIELKR